VVHGKKIFRIPFLKERAKEKDVFNPNNKLTQQSESNCTVSQIHGRTATSMIGNCLTFEQRTKSVADHLSLSQALA